MKKITLENGKTVEISDEIYNNLAKATTSSMPWRTKKNDEYWAVKDSGGFMSTIDSYQYTDNFRYATGNYFRTSKEAENEAERKRALGRVRLAIFEANDGWEPDWKDKWQAKNYIVCNVRKKVFGYTFSCDEKFSIDLPYIASEEIADEIIENHKKDLKRIFGVE